jgi:hypothetical protein
MLRLLLEILIVFVYARMIFKFVAARGGSAWLWASLGAAGFFIVVLSICIAVKEYFLDWSPLAGFVWIILVGLVMRFRFRRAPRINP